MKIRVERRGGLAGTPAIGERELADLTPEQRRALDALVKPPPGRAAATPAPPNRIHPLRYKITLIDGAQRQEFEIPEDDMPDVLASIPKVDLR